MKLSSLPASRHRGVALVLVLSCLVLVAALAIGFLLSTTTELRSTTVFAEGSRARLFADDAVNLVIGQLRDATTGGSNVAWASQPGMIKTFDDQGAPKTAYKLYSSPTLRVSGVFNPDDDAPPAEWATRPAEYIDLNSPLTVRDKAYYPIIDPAAIGKVEGFSVSDSAFLTDTNGDGKNDIPMPAQWLYVLEDGTIGPASLGTAQNPIAGRLAFWTDDDTCKINVNTASEGTFWDTPRAETAAERTLARSQPVQREWQRYPGHPAMTSLSPVLFGAATSLTAAQKAQIYQLVPRIAGGGSQAGTVDVSSTVKPITVDQDRLYATIDEFLYDPQRQTQSVTDSSGNPLITPDVIERSRFFLTTNSRAPDVNMFNLPRISVWPVHAYLNMPSATLSLDAADLYALPNIRDTIGNSKYTTPYDRLIAFCSTIGGHPFYFQRALADSPTRDYTEIARNRELYAYAKRLMNRDVPGFGKSFSDKFLGDSDQILTECFDYIRSTNLFDTNLGKQMLFNPSTKRYDIQVPGDTDTDIRRVMHRATYVNSEINNKSDRSAAFPSNDEDSPGDNDFYFFTNPMRVERVVSGDNEESYRNSGHGQVVPLKIGTTRGMGRFLAVTEATMLLYCNSDPIADPESEKNRFWPVANMNNTNTRQSTTDPAVDYTNDPGYSTPDPDGEHSRLVTFNPATPRRRIMGQLMFEYFCPSQGNTFYGPRAYVEAEGLEKLEVKNWKGEWQSLYKYAPLTSGSVKLTEALMGEIGSSFGRDDVAVDSMARSWGGSFHRLAAGRGNDHRSWVSGAKQQGDGYAVHLFGTNAVLLRKDQGLEFRSTGLITVRVYSSYRGYKPVNPILTDVKGDLLQTITLKFPDASLPGGPNARPSLPTTGAGRITDKRVFWGSGRQSAAGTSTLTATGVNVAGSGNTIGGRFGSGELGNRDGLIRGNHDVVLSLVPAHGDARLLMGRESYGTDDGTFVPMTGYGQAATPTANALVEAGNSDGNAGVEMGGKFAAVNYPRAVNPDLPIATAKPQQTGDWDSGQTPFAIDGAYINKPDEGNTFQAQDAQTKTPYFDSVAQSKGPGPNYFSPNRMVPSPGMFGSLPTGVQRNRPWETLLFRPQPTHPNALTGPPDHLIMDLFTMPTVEPYAISEPLSTAGKINLNWKIAPFTYIRRATPIYALLAAEKVTAISNNWVASYKTAGSSNTYDLRLPINPAETLKGFEQRFDNTTGDGAYLFKSASELCELHLVPQGQTLSGMTSFWQQHALTGDNLRERPYANIYPRVTTKSNSYTVHVRVQAVKKVPNTPPDQFDPTRDQVMGEYRGSYQIERYIDANDPRLPDFAAPGVTETVDAFYRFRILSAKQFAP